MITSRHWQVFETFKLHFERTANELAEQDRDPTLVGLTVSKRQFERWYGGEVKTRPYPALCRVLEAMFRYPVDVLLGPAEESGATADAGPRLRLVMPTRPPSSSLDPTEGNSGFDGIEFTSRPAPGDSTGRDTLERQVAMAARRAFRFSAMAEGSTIGPETLDELHQEVRRLAAAYPRLPLATLLGDLVEVQDLSFHFLEHGRVRPTQARELYLLSAITSGMLAKASHDLGDPRSAMTQARTAYVCADNADHHAMRAWVRGLQSLIAYWDGRHQEASQYAGLGISQVAGVTGTSAVWLSCLHARAGAALGDAAAVRESLAEAERARDAVSPDDLDEFGGIMTFPVPRQLYYAADATAWLPDAPEAEQQAEAAVAAYRQAEPEDWAFGDQAGAYTDLALARVRAGTLDGVDEAMRPVLDLPADQRINGIVASVRQVHTALRDPRWLTAPEARTAREEIEAFTAAPVAALPR
ncbi:hypothetical protein [Streptomyces sp. BHT-5-2]|uniref:hypothetical protein n=1 Tax=Streptomyces sp. BHT-5-2 TaxID=2866715 RepID=UPI0021B1246D|nr:hypothetical protein [Streptomyces sp. BHT-5-2]